MDAKRFDAWTRNRALRLSRRQALCALGATSAAAALASTGPNALAQGGPPCKLTIHAATAGGPSAPATYDGALQFTLGPDGNFTQATFTPQNGPPQPVTGQADGRAIDLRIALGSDRFLVLTGAGDQPISTCAGALGGIFSGPQPGDLGAWEATAAPASGSAAPPLGSGQSSSSSSGSSNATCQSPMTPCGSACCPTGATCDRAASLCTCPAGTEQCGNQCVPSCADGQLVDLDTCTCPPPAAPCVPNQQTCQNHGQCCSGYCGGGTCFDCVGKVCGDFGCIDPNRDSQNCGNCGKVCVFPQVCNGGVCGCAPDDAPCFDHSECCSQYCDVSGACETCSNILSTGPNAPSAPSTFCGLGICTDLRTDIDHCGECFKSCPRTSGGIVCDQGVCHDINSDPNYCGFSAEVCGPGQICHLGDCINA